MKEILVFSDGAEDARARVAMAWALAEVMDAHLEVYRPSSAPLAPYGVDIPSVEAAYQHVISSLQAAEQKALGETIASIAPLGPRFSAQAHMIPSPRIRDAAAIATRTADLAIVGRPEICDGTRADTDLLLGALFGAGAPCLLLPRWIEPRLWGKRAVVAWKGTPEASRALHAALPMLARADSVRLVIVNPREGWAGEDHRSVMRLATHIARHGVNLEEPLTIKTPDTLDHIVEKAIMSEIECFNADLLVLGAYGHSRWGEVLLGGVTQSVIRNATIPVLMAH